MSEPPDWAQVHGATWLSSSIKPAKPRYWSDLLGSERRIDPYLVWADLTTKPGSPQDAKVEVTLLVEKSHAQAGGNKTSILPLHFKRLDDFVAALSSTQYEAMELSMPRVIDAKQNEPYIPYSLTLTSGVSPSYLLTEIGVDAFSKLNIAVQSPSDLFGGKEGLFRLFSQLKELPNPVPVQGPPLMSAIDDRCNFASRAFGTRIETIWNQTTEVRAVGKLDATKRWDKEPSGRGGRVCETFRGYGPSGQRTEADWYRGVGYMYPSPRWSHGSAVLDVLAGHDIRLPQVGPGIPREEIGRQRWPALPPKRLVFVQLPVSTVLDTSGASLATHVYDGIEFVMDRAKEGQSVVVNLSYGTHSGPHDGDSMFERALCELLDRYDGKDKLSRGKTLHVVAPAGNAHLQRCHAFQTLAPGQEMKLRWKVLPDDPTDNFVEVWLGPNDEIGVVVEPPCGPSSPLIKRGAGVSWKAGPDVRAAVVFSSKVVQSRTGRMVLVAVAPTREGGYTTATATIANPRTGQASVLGLAPHGVWTIKICNTKTSNGRPEQCADVHAWVQRGDFAPGRGRETRGYTGRQAYFIDDGTGLVNPRFTLNGIATAKHQRLFVVGAMRHQDHAVSKYSGAGPNRHTGERLEGPDLVTLGDESIHLPGLLLRGTSAGSHVRVSGTSVAAPFVARLLYEHLAAGNKADTFVALWSRYGAAHVDRHAEGAPEEAPPVYRGDCVRLVPTDASGALIRATDLGGKPTTPAQPTPSGQMGPPVSIDEQEVGWSSPVKS